jgi:enamine deaminase RidA (YjgF/YER057c/UK114 family)
MYMDASQLVNVYIKIRDAKETRKKQMDAEIADLDAQLAAVEQELLEICKTTGQDGGKTQFGSFTRAVKTRYWTSDWDSMYKFIREHDAPDLLERRIAQGNFAQFIQENPDKMPAGVNIESKYSITVRRSSK